MEWWQAIILGIIEGVTEYLPVSSTGHLIVAQRLMGMGLAADKDAADAYAICIQFGAIMAVLGLYRPRVVQMINGLRGRDPVGLQLAINIIAAFVPAAILGLTFNKLIKYYLFGVWPVVIAWFVGGVAILAVARMRKSAGEGHSKEGMALAGLTWKLALIIGVAQCIAMWPGVSRSLVTIVGGVLVGMRLAAAVEFSFLLGMVTLTAATCKDFAEHHEAMLELYSPLSLLLGLVFAFASAWLAVKWMVAYLNKHGLEIFGFYRVAIALVTAALIAAGVLHAGDSPAKEPDTSQGRQAPVVQPLASTGAGSLSLSQ